MKLSQKKIIIISIIIFFFSLLSKTFLIDKLPPSLFSDEADASYQALVFNNYQSDYYGNKFPIHFHSFSDWRTPLYIYSISLTSLFTDNVEISARFPSAFFMSLSALAFFLILLKIKLKTTSSLLGTLVYILNPWLFHYGHTAFEVSGMIFVIMVAILSFLNYLEKNKKIYLYFSVFFFSLAPLFYSTAKLSILFIGISLLLIWRKEIFKLSLKNILSLSLFTLLCFSPLIIDTLRSRAGFRFSYISIFSEPNISKQVDNLRYQDIYTDHLNEIGVSPSLESKIYHNRITLVADKFITNYISSFSTDFLLLKGDSNLRHGFSNHGYFFLVDALLFFIGISYFLQLKKSPLKKISLFFFLIFLTTPIPFALTRDSLSPHATRLILMAPSALFFIALGIDYLMQSIKNRPLSILFVSISILIYSLSFHNFFHQYRFHYPQISAMDWHTGIKEAVLESNSVESIDNIFYSSKYESMLPFFLVYKPYLPKETPISQHIQHTDLPYFVGTTIDNQYYFGEIKWSQIDQYSKDLTNSLFVIPKSEYLPIPNKESFKIEKEIQKSHINQAEFLILKLTNDQ